MTFSIGHTGTEDSWNQSMCLKIKEKLEEYSGGKIKVNIYANAQMGSDSEMIPVSYTHLDVYKRQRYSGGESERCDPYF